MQILEICRGVSYINVVKINNKCENLLLYICYNNILYVCYNHYKCMNEILLRNIFVSNPSSYLYFSLFVIVI